MPFASAEERPAQAPCTPGAAPLQSDAQSIIPLPTKPTCTPPEAARALGISSRQVRYLVEDGTLLAIDASRRVASGPDRDRRRTPWRVVVRRGTDLNREGFDRFMSLEEYVQQRSNMADGG